MHRTSKTALACLLLVASSSAASAQTTWIVDDDGGPGVDFTSIQSALAVAGPLDLVDVQAGTYAPFQMTGAARIMGRLGAEVTGRSIVQSVAADSWALIADIEMDELYLLNSAGTILLDGVEILEDEPALVVESCNDVRGRGVKIEPSAASSSSCAVINESRVQFESSQFLAGNQLTEGADGQTAIRASGGSFLHLAECVVEGGSGGAGIQLLFFIPPGVGGHGVRLTEDSSLRVTRSIVRGGAGGLDPTFPFDDAEHGSAIYQCGGETREWECILEAGTDPLSVAPPAPTLRLECGATLDNSFHLPTFQLVGNQAPGSVVSMDVAAYVNSSIRLIAGRVPVLEPTPTTSLERLVDIGRFGSLGAVPASGRLSVPLVVPSWPRGTAMFLQASSTHASGVTDWTNSVVLLVR